MSAYEEALRDGLRWRTRAMKVEEAAAYFREATLAYVADLHQHNNDPMVYQRYYDAGIALDKLLGPLPTDSETPEAKSSGFHGRLMDRAARMKQYLDEHPSAAEPVPLKRSDAVATYYLLREMAVATAEGLHGD